MGKWLAIAAVALLALIVVLWRQLEASPIAEPAPQPAAAPAPVPASTAPVAVPAPAPAPVEPAPPTPPRPDKIDVESDAFYTKFLDVVPAMLSRPAAACYDNLAERDRVTRNQELSLKYKIRIKNGDVTISDVRVVKNTLD